MKSRSTVQIFSYDAEARIQKSVFKTTSYLLMFVRSDKIGGAKFQSVQVEKIDESVTSHFRKRQLLQQTLEGCQDPHWAVFRCKTLSVI